MNPLPHTLARLQADWDAIPPPPPPPSTALFDRGPRPSWRVIITGAAALYAAGLAAYGVVLAVAAIRMGMLS
jgi:hypothetical protein